MDTAKTGISLPSNVMKLADRQAKAARRTRSAHIAWLIEQEEHRIRAPRQTETRQSVGA